MFKLLVIIALLIFTVTLLALQHMTTSLADETLPHDGATANARECDEEGFTSILNGKDLSGWKGKPGVWFIEDGAITGVSTPQMPCVS